MYPDYDYTIIEHIQGYLLSHQELINLKFPSGGSIYDYKINKIDSQYEDILDIIIDEIIKKMKCYSNYKIENDDAIVQESLKNNATISIINTNNEFINIIKKWFIDTHIMENTCVSASRFTNLINALYENKCLIYTINFNENFKSSINYPRHMCLALGIQFDLFIIVDNHQDELNKNWTLLKFGNEIT